MKTEFYYSYKKAFIYIFYFLLLLQLFNYNIYCNLYNCIIFILLIHLFIGTKLNICNSKSTNVQVFILQYLFNIFIYLLSSLSQFLLKTLDFLTKE